MSDVPHTSISVNVELCYSRHWYLCLSQRIANHSMSIADLLVPQLGFQGVKELGKQVSSAGGANDCTCRK